MKGYEFLEGITVADVAFRANGSSLSQLFENAAMAVTVTMVKEPSSLGIRVRKKVRMSTLTVEQLLHDFLEELVYLKDAENLLFSEFKVKIDENDLPENNGNTGEKGKFLLIAQMVGGTINPESQELLVDVKAVTWHKFWLKKEGKNYAAQVVLDV